MNGQSYFYGTGKRKTAIARVRLYSGNGNFTVNAKPFEKTYGTENAKRIVLQPFQATNSVDKYDVVAKVHGGGTSGQVDAIKHGISRALLVSDENLKPVLRGHGFLTRDSRIKERQKYGFRRARKRKQYRKR